MTREKGGFWVGLTAVVFYPLTWLLGRWRIEGLDRIPRSGAALVVSNHISYLDPVYTAVFIHRARRVPRFLAKASLWKIPVFGKIMAGSGQIPVYRESMDAQHSLSAAAEALTQDKVVTIYPEGTITRDPKGWPMHARTGVARLALASDVPVIPMVHWGTLDVYDHYNKKVRPLPRKEIVVACGEPIDMTPYRGREVDAALLREVTDHLMTVVKDLLAEVRGEPAPAGFYRRGRAKADAAPEAAVGTALGAPVDTAPEAAVDAAPEAAVDAAPEAAVGTAPEAAVDAASEAPVGTAAERSSEAPVDRPTTGEAAS